MKAAIFKGKGVIELGKRPDPTIKLPSVPSSEYSDKTLASLLTLPPCFTITSVEPFDTFWELLIRSWIRFQRLSGVLNSNDMPSLVSFLT